MANYITVDGGTTNTRVSLVCDRKIIDTKKMRVGAGNRDLNLLKNSIKEAISSLLCEHGCTEKDILRILASGMITSEYGLCNLKHVSAPAGIEELHASMHEVVIPEISEIPFVFIRGVKTEGDIESSDMMRGEETELIGILENEKVDTVYVLPGSHSKLIRVDALGRIVDIGTMLTGEMIAALSGHTILKDSVDLGVKDTDGEYLLRGYEYCSKRGINEALFKVRVLKNILAASTEQTYSFFIGVVLASEIQSIIESASERVVISGQAQIARALFLILKASCKKDIVLLDKEKTEYSTVLGAIRIYEGV